MKKYSLLTAVSIISLCYASDASALCVYSDTIRFCAYSNEEMTSLRYGPSYATTPGGIIHLPLYIVNTGNDDIGVMMIAQIDTRPVPPAVSGDPIARHVLISGWPGIVRGGQTGAFGGILAMWALDSAGNLAYPIPYGEYRLKVRITVGAVDQPTTTWILLSTEYPDENYNPVYIVSSRHGLTISRHNTATLTNAEADSILNDASSALVNSDGQDDVACPVALVRWHDVGQFNTTDGSIDTDSELIAVLDLPGNVKVVDDVNFCNGIFNTSYYGCGQRPGTSFIIERSTDEGIHWAHEFGHNQDLPHRDTSINNLMNKLSFQVSRRVNQEECNAFKRYRGQIAATDAVARTQTSTVGGEPMPVEEFVTRIYFHGLPLAQAATYGENDVDTLLVMLNDPSVVQYHENIALTLGMIGSERAVDPLISYINRGAATEGTISQPAYKGRVGAVVALGYLVNLTGNQKALSYLLESTSPAIWLQRDIKGLTEKTMRDLSKYAIISLGLSGHPTAAAHLRSLRDQEGAADERSFRTKIIGVLDQSLQISEEVSRNGLLKYYEKDVN